MKIERFEDLISWRKARELTINIYNQFRNYKDYGFKNQIERAPVSIMNNIAEGFERNTNKEMRNFMYISKGSCGEVRSMRGLALQFKYITKEEFDNNHDLSIEISRLLSGFIKKL